MQKEYEKAAISIVSTLQSQGHLAYFAGGYVRDMLMKHPSDDIDIATSATVEEIQQLFAKTIPVGIQFGIVIVVIDNDQFEVASFRKESQYLDGRRPTSIERATPEEDALRRDFTINGMFFDPTTNEIIDYVNGREDIKSRCIKAIGDPNHRFLEDRLRMIRAVRYATRFGFDIDPKTRRALVKHAEKLFPSVAIERVWQELQKMATFSRFDHALVALQKMQLLPVIFPTLSGESIEQRLVHLPHFPKQTPLIAQILELFPHYDLPQKLILCDFLKLPNQDRAFVTFYHHLGPLLFQELDPYRWAYLYANPHFKVSYSLYLARLSQAAKEALICQHEKRQAQLLPHIKRIQDNDPIVKAKHLIKKGYAPGPELGKLLKQAERLAINENLTTPDEILKKLL